MHRSILAGVLGGDGGQLSGDHPKQGPNSQLEGLRRRHVALTDQILQIALGRTRCPLADGKRDISPASVEPPPPRLHGSARKTSHSRTSSLTPQSLSYCFSSAWPLCRVPSDVLGVMLSMLNLNSCQDLADPPPLTGTITKCSCSS